MNSKSIFKAIALYSFSAGAAAGLIPLIPAFAGAAFSIVMLLSAPFVLFCLYKMKLIDSLEINQRLSIGAASGFFSFLGFALVYFPIAYVLHIIFKIDSFLWIKVLLENFGFIIPMTFLGALFCGLMNMFSAFMTVYFYDYLRPKNRG